MLDQAPAVAIACSQLAKKRRRPTPAIVGTLSVWPWLAAHRGLLLIWLDRGFAGETPTGFLHDHAITVEIAAIKRCPRLQFEPRRCRALQTFGIVLHYLSPALTT